MFCEPYLATGRHIEVQILADAHGTVWTFGERECSIQRRHQKVIEETPSPLVERVRRCAAAVRRRPRPRRRDRLRRRAGTVEFLADEDGDFFFLEMNTRLQVEHPVTECVTGLDLVALQLRIAEGQPLPSRAARRHAGHAIEVRLYAEDPAAGWQPQSGTLHRFDVPGVTAEFANPPSFGLRLDSGVVDGSVVGVHYDPMLAKVIAWAPTRDEAARSLAGALARTRVHGLITNRDLLVRVLRHPAFLAGDIDTAFFDRHGLAALAEPLAGKHAVQLSALAAALADAAATANGASVQGTLPSGWRNVPSQPQRKTFSAMGGEIEVAYLIHRGKLRADGHEGVALIECSPTRVVLDVDGLRRSFDVSVNGAGVAVDSVLGPVALTAVERFPDPRFQEAPGSLLAPMPGRSSGSRWPRATPSPPDSRCCGWRP